MKRVFFYLIAIALLASCGNNPKAKKIVTYQDAEEQFQSSLSASDTNAVFTLTQAFLKQIKEGQLDEALNNIYVLEDNVLTKPSSEYIQKLRSRFTLFPVYGFKIDRYSFSTPGNNDFCFLYTFMESVDGQPDKTMRLVFNPVFAQGKWYLTFKDGNQSSRDLPQDQQVTSDSPAPKPIQLGW